MGYLIIAKKENRLHFHLKTEQVLRVEVHEEKDVIKKSANVVVNPGETIVLAETDGPGEINSFWFGGVVTNSFILRIYWDEQLYPSVECPLAAFFGYAYENALTDLDGKYRF